MKAPENDIPWYGSSLNIFCFVLTEGVFIFQSPPWLKLGSDISVLSVVVLCLPLACFSIKDKSLKLVLLKWLLFSILFFGLFLEGVPREILYSLPGWLMVVGIGLGYLLLYWKTLERFFSKISFEKSVEPLPDKNSDSPVAVNSPEEIIKEGLDDQKKIIIGVSILGAMAAVYYQLLNHYHLEQTAALFIGLPALLAMGFALVPVKSISGHSMKWTLVALMASGMFLGEGFVCIVMAAPLFLGITGGIGEMVEKGLVQKNSMKAYALLLFLPMMFEGTTDFFSFDRNETVVVEREVELTARQIEWRFANTPFIEKPLPLFLQLGFPVPTQVSGTGLEPGAVRRVWFQGSKRSGALIMKLENRGDNFVLFKRLRDESHIAHWMSWESNRTEWTRTSRGTYKVTSIIKFRRELDPYWYFAPLERYAVGLAGDHFLETYLG